MKETNIELDKSEIEKKAKRIFQMKKEPPKSLQSFMRNQNKLMTSTIALLDRKAMILIRINSALVSGLIIFQEFIRGKVEFGQIITVVLVVGSLASLVLAILAVKPFANKFLKIYDNELMEGYKELKYNNFFLVDPISLKEYEKSMDKVIRSQELQIGNMVRINYILNMIVRKKYLILDWAYTIFLTAFVVVGIVFLVSQFM